MNWPVRSLRQHSPKSMETDTMEMATATRPARMEVVNQTVAVQLKVRSGQSTRSPTGHESTSRRSFNSMAFSLSLI